ncbi:MAG: hypothetical protein GTO63_27140, partial [Anaerolineae bacterium]|nr:hypothetical protein [Anaerolineae bacterium]NIN98412.1 hypothetical protein [Anaerolineae bacterium]NIQ80729.1 hypothetical protein [Anaerolineae bacterium]
MFQQIDSFVQAVQVIALGLIFFCCMGVNIGAVLVVLRATKRRLKLPRHRRTLGIKDLQDSQSTG